MDASSLAQELIKNLYISNYESLDKVVPGLLRPGDVIVKCAQELPDPISPNHIIVNWDIQDVPNQLLTPYIYSLVNLIISYLDSGKKVLVYCHMGISRSATLVAAVMMKKLGITSDEAIYLVSQKRPIINPNNGFRKQLKALNFYFK